MLMFAAVAAAAYAPHAALQQPQPRCRPRAAILRRRCPVVTGDETKGAIGGAVLGGLLAGPFGALWGAQLGGVAGANARVKRAEEEKIQSMGLDKATVAAMQQCVQELKEAEESLDLVKNAERSQRQVLDNIDTAMTAAYTAAEAALRSGDEALARTKLEEKNALKPRREAAERETAAAASRVATMAASVAALAERAAQLEQAMAKTVAAATSSKAAARSQGMVDAPSTEVEELDPLEQKFRDLEGR